MNNKQLCGSIRKRFEFLQGLQIDKSSGGSEVSVDDVCLPVYVGVYVCVCVCGRQLSGEQL